jgi:phage repressor protein C with HTH and peptisase S24 domain
MDSLGSRLKEARQRAGLSQRELADAADMEQPSYQAVESGKVRGTKFLTKLAEALNVDANWLLTGKTAAPRSLADSPRPFVPQERPLSGDTLPILGTAEGGPDGLLAWNGDVIDHIARPPSLGGAKDAYALYVTGTSMEPRYRQGELIYVHPGRPAVPGAFVVVQFSRDGTPMPAALVKQFVRRDDKHLVLHQLNPAKDLKIPAAQILCVHRIVGTSE